MPAELSGGCQDPGIDPDAKRALVQHRLAWAECRRLQQDTVSFYGDVKEEFEGSSPQ